VDVCPEPGALGLAGGKAILLDPAKCVGHAKCIDACPTSALSLARGNVLQTLRVPLVSEEFETSVPGLFIAGELGGMGLIKTAINEGRLAEDQVRRRLSAWGVVRRTAVDCHGVPRESVHPPDGTYDVAIIGAGPAGLSASLAAHHDGLDCATLEQGWPKPLLRAARKGALKRLAREQAARKGLPNQTYLKSLRHQALHRVE